MDISNNFDYASYSGCSIHNDFLASSGSSTGLIQNPYSFMWGQFFNEQELESIVRYHNSPFDDDFYKYLIYSNLNYTGSAVDNYEHLRQKLKDNMMLILFDDNFNHRHHIDNINMFRKIFPGVDKWIVTLHMLIGNDSFSYLLQRTESYLILDVICKEFNEKYPLAPIYSIHDAICTYPEYLPDLKELILGRFYEITGIKVGLKLSPWIYDQEPKLGDIDEEWAKIKSVRTLNKYREANYQVFSSNIERGSRFLS